MNGDSKLNITSTVSREYKVGIYSVASVWCYLSEIASSCTIDFPTGSIPGLVSPHVTTKGFHITQKVLSYDVL